jgi:hypothetical protein
MILGLCLPDKEQVVGISGNQSLNNYSRVFSVKTFSVALAVRHRWFAPREVKRMECVDPKTSSYFFLIKNPLNLKLRSACCQGRKYARFLSSTKNTPQYYEAALQVS